MITAMREDKALAAVAELSCLVAPQKMMQNLHAPLILTGPLSSIQNHRVIAGEAPEEGAIFRQRSRWCKGHMQALMSSENPLLQPRLSPLLRVLYTAGTWCSPFCWVGEVVWGLTPQAVGLRGKGWSAVSCQASPWCYCGGEGLLP